MRSRPRRCSQPSSNLNDQNTINSGIDIHFDFQHHNPLHHALPEPDRPLSIPPNLGFSSFLDPSVPVAPVLLKPNTSIPSDYSQINHLPQDGPPPSALPTSPPPPLPLPLPPPTISLDLDPFLASLEPIAARPPDKPLPTFLDSVPPQLAPPLPPPAPAAPRTYPPHLPRSKLNQVLALRQAANYALDGIALTIASAGPDGLNLVISPALDRRFAELHNLAAPFKKDQLALIWPQCISNRSLKANITSGHQTLSYFAVRKANIAFVGEYVLYAMPGEEAYGKNDIVFACEGFLPLVLDKEMVSQEESWKIFNELKVQIYIQRLEQSGRSEADTRVLPNLFVESLASYSGHQVPPEAELAFDKLAAETKQEIIDADARLDVLLSKHPYRKFASWTLTFLQRCASRVSEQERLAQAAGTMVNELRRRRRASQGPALERDICVDQLGDEEYPNSTQSADHTPKGRYNPYKLGRGKGASSLPRRRWTQSEHELLLEEVRLFSNKYDCMAQIIKRHGKEGEVSDTLRNQNNVSLKDKARNLTMEWERHGYPLDKPWLKEAFARFSVKAQKLRPLSPVDDDGGGVCGEGDGGAVSRADIGVVRGTTVEGEKEGGKARPDGDGDAVAEAPVKESGQEEVGGGPVASLGRSVAGEWRRISGVLDPVLFRGQQV